MSRQDFGAYYAALGLAPGATEAEIARAKRAYNELYHSDRLAHMSEEARTIASEKVKAANEAAQALLDPANRFARDAWAREAPRRSDAQGARSSEPEPPEASTPDPPPRTERHPNPAGPLRHRHHGTRRLVVVGLTTGAFLGTLAVAVSVTMEQRSAQATSASGRDLPPAPSPTATPSTRSSPAGRPVSAAPRGTAARVVLDSIVELPADGRWTRSIAGGGASFGVSFMPESDRANYRVRTDDGQLYVLLGEPGFRKVTGPARGYEFSSLTGTPVRLRFSRWREPSAQGATVHRLVVAVPGDGSWSSRVYLGDMQVQWDPDRKAPYEVRDQGGRITHILPEVGSVHFAVYPEWVQFRSTDSLPLQLTVRYSVP